jgi:ATP-dependent 26S proteasome regulatory subunit
VILPEQTLRLLDRNILGFVGSRASLRRLGQSTRKGILLYGPPGTGKTHTIRYLATNLPGHTTLIITAEQVAFLGVYMNLARLLQPALVVIEDVDLIARDRNEMAGPCEESLLNKLLNEMDGLKEDADILFVLTTNRPEQLEAALAGRPGRIDQAIEVPLPDMIGRDKLVRLYGKGLPLDQDLVDETVARTEGVSAAFIKELMRRIAQNALARDGAISVVSTDIGRGA